jgi:hypothetical protein
MCTVSPDISNLILNSSLKGTHPRLFPSWPLPADPRKLVCALVGPSTSLRVSCRTIFRTPLPPLVLATPSIAAKALLSCRHRERLKPPHDRSEQTPCQVPSANSNQ